MAQMATELLYLRGAYLVTFDAHVVDVDAEAGGWRWTARRSTRRVAASPTTPARRVPKVAHARGLDPLPAAGDHVHGSVDWDRRRAHAHPTALRAVRRHLERVAGAGDGREHGAALRPAWTSSSIRCLRALARVEELVNAELAAAGP